MRPTTSTPESHHHCGKKVAKVQTSMAERRAWWPSRPDTRSHSLLTTARWPPRPPRQKSLLWWWKRVLASFAFIQLIFQFCFQCLFDLDFCLTSRSVVQCVFLRTKSSTFTFLDLNRAVVGCRFFSLLLASRVCLLSKIFECLTTLKSLTHARITCHPSRCHFPHQFDVVVVLDMAFYGL